MNQDISQCKHLAKGALIKLIRISSQTKTYWNPPKLISHGLLVPSGFEINHS